jgi:hypothetical protein
MQGVPAEADGSHHKYPAALGIPPLIPRVLRAAEKRPAVTAAAAAAADCWPGYSITAAATAPCTCRCRRCTAAGSCHAADTLPAAEPRVVRQRWTLSWYELIGYVGQSVLPPAKGHHQHWAGGQRSAESRSISRRASVHCCELHGGDAKNIHSRTGRPVMGKARRHACAFVRVWAMASCLEQHCGMRWHA